MLACIQRWQNFTSQHLVCTPKVLDVPTLPFPLPVPPLQPGSQRGDSGPTTPRYPSPAELDAFAQKTAHSPLSIKIFPSNIRVPQHKQLNRTVNGLDTTGRYSPYSHPYSGGHQGLLAVVKATTVARGVVKDSDGKRTKHAHSQTAVALYNSPLNTSYAADRHGHKAYHISSCKPPDPPAETPSSGVMVSALAPRSEPLDVHRLMRQMNRVPQSQAPQLSPPLRAVAAVARSDSGFVLGVPPQSGLAFSGAVLPTQSADTAQVGYLDNGEYGVWQQKQQHQIQQQQQHYQHRMLRMHSSAQGCRGGESMMNQSPETCLPLACSARLAYRPHPLSAGASGAAQERTGSPTPHGELAAGRYFAPPWDAVAATPHTDCYTQELAAGPSLGRARDAGLSRLRPLPYPGCHPASHPPQCSRPQLRLPAHPGAYSADQSLCCGLPSSSLCHASVLSSSLLSLECLINEIHPPCIKERMLGRGYEAVGLPRLLEHHPATHVQLPVYR